MIIDSHCHLNILKNNTIKQNINDAKKHGTEQIINIATTLEEVKDLSNISKLFNNVFFSVGVHPNEIHGMQPLMYETIINYINFNKYNNCIAIGETGLDYFYNTNDEIIYYQQKKFKAHIEAAKILNKPIIIHTRSADMDTINILKAFDISKFGGVIHSFTGNWELAKQFLDMGLYLSISGIITFKNQKDLQETVKKIPLDRLLIETDSPYLTPVPFRGKPNYPKYLYKIAEFLSILRSEKLDFFSECTKNNTIKLFNIREYMQ